MDCPAVVFKQALFAQAADAVCVVVRFQCSSASANFTSADVVTGAFAQIRSANRASINPICSSGMAGPPFVYAL